MGNILRKLCSFIGEEDTTGQYGHGLAYQAAPLGPHGVTVDTVGYAALARDLFQFEITNQVPDGLDSYVQSGKPAQKKWYSKLHEAWKSADPPPNNAEEASQLVLETLRGHRKVDVEGFLSFYGLGGSTTSTVAVPAPSVVVPGPPAVNPQVAVAVGPWPKGVQYELHTLPLEGNSAVDGDTVTVFVDATDDAREAAAVPLPVQDALSRWRTARLHNDYKTADALQKEVQKAGYRILDSNKENGFIVRRYKVRLRGIDAPESSMPFGPEAKAMLQSVVEGQPLRLLVYTVDRYGRLVADAHCNQGFVQEILLKNGSCWHYIAYDKRPEFSEVQMRLEVCTHLSTCDINGCTIPAAGSQLCRSPDTLEFPMIIPIKLVSRMIVNTHSSVELPYSTAVPTLYCLEPTNLHDQKTLNQPLIAKAFYTMPVL